MSEGDSDLLVVAPRWDAARAGQQSWLSETVAVDDVGAALPALLEARGRRGAVRWAVAGWETASHQARALLEPVVGPTPTRFDDELVGLAAQHDRLSLWGIERAVAIAEAGYAHMCEVAQPGVREFEVAAEADAYMRGIGADDNFLLMSASQHNYAVHAPTDRRLCAGDVLLGEISPSVGGQFAQICRSVVIGGPNALQESCYAVLQESFKAGLDEARPDAKAADVARAVDAVLVEHGYGEYARPPYMRSRGHAMGLTPVVPADISTNSTVTLKTGMSFVLHPNQYLPEVGYLLCGDQVVITDNGARSLSGAPLALDTIVRERVAS